MLLIVGLFSRFTRGYFHSLYLFICKWFHSACLTHVHRFGKTKATTKPNQTKPLNMLLCNEKRGEKEDRSSRDSAELRAALQVTEEVLLGLPLLLWALPMPKGR